MESVTRGKTTDMAYIAVFAVIIAICAWICIPAAVPFTLQTFGVFLTLVVLGGKRGTLAVLVYILLGMVGVPVFSGFKGGIGSLFGSTGGYILGFLLSGLVMWLFEMLFGKKKWVLAVSMIVGLLACYLFGTIWFMVIYTSQSGAIGIGTALAWCVFPFVVPDVVKLILAFVVGKRLKRAIQ